MIINANAKLNIYLEVLAKRTDGYHDILSIMVPISICDKIYLERKGKGIELECDDPSLPQDKRNLAFQAATLYLNEANIKEGVYIRISKNIPVAAGLGGGSSDAAAVLKGLNMLYGKLSQSDLLKLAKEIGADCPFFLYEGPCLAKGIGDMLEPLPQKLVYFVLITPPVHVSTAWVYNQYNSRFGLTKSEQSSIKMLWEEGKIKALLKNDLEKVTKKYFPIIDEIKNLLSRQGAKGVLMSGSGPTVFGIFDSEQESQRAVEHIPAEIGKVFVASSLINKHWGVAKR